MTSGAYNYIVAVSNRNGTPGNPATIRANSSVVIDGSNDYSNEQSWSQYNQSNVWSASVPFSGGSAQNQVIVDGTRYLYIAPDSLPVAGDYTTVPQNRFTYGTGQSVVYVNAAGDNPGDYHTTTISVRAAGIDVDNSSYLVIDGFTVERTTDKGIDVRGTGTDGDSLNIRDVRIMNCTSKLNARQGIFLRNGVNCTVDNNITFMNASHGIHLPLDSACVVVRNRSYLNDDPYKTNIAGGITGIKVGDSGAKKDARYITLDYNVAYDNEDTGIELKGSKRILARRNVSYSNGDHGFDNLVTDSTVFLNNVAARNDHDGLSIEDNAKNVQVYGCILWHNGVNPTTLNEGSDPRVREMFVDNDTGFVSNHNVICGLAPDTTSAYTRYLVEFPGSGVTHAYASWARYRQNQASQDSASYPFEPGFVDSTTIAGFKVTGSSSDAVDAAKTDLSGWMAPFWLSTDPRGFVPHNNDSIPNAGVGSPAFADMGAYEYDVEPSAITDFQADIVTSSSVHLMWTDTGDDGVVGSARDTLRISDYTPITEASFNSIALADTQPSLRGPGTTRSYSISGLPMCTLYYYGLRAGGGENSLWSPVAVETVITSPIWYGGQWVCDGLRSGDTSRARRGARAAGAVELAASVAGGVLPGASSTAGRGPIMLEAIPSGNGLDLKVVALNEGDAPGYREEGGAGVFYQTPDGAGAWTTRVQYALPEGDGLALLAPKQPGRWVFLEPLTARGVKSTPAVSGLSWQLEEARHSRLGDVTTTLAGTEEAPELAPGDTLVVRYSATGAGAGSPRSWLVALGGPSGGTTPTRAGRGDRDQASTTPTAFALHQNQPNPFASSTALRFDLPRAETVRLEVFDLMGRRVARVRDAWMPAGRHSLDWESRDSKGTPIRPGTYLYRLTAGSFRAQRKLVVLP